MADDCIMQWNSSQCLLHNQLKVVPGRSIFSWWCSTLQFAVFFTGVGTKIDPTLCRADRLVGQVSNHKKCTQTQFNDENFAQDDLFYAMHCFVYIIEVIKLLDIYDLHVTCKGLECICIIFFSPTSASTNGPTCTSIILYGKGRCPV